MLSLFCLIMSLVLFLIEASGLSNNRWGIQIGWLGLAFYILYIMTGMAWGHALR